MKLLLRLAALALFAHLSGVAVSQPPARSVNITSDFAPGWIPSEDQEAMAQKAALDFLKAKDQARYSEAFAMFASTMKSYLTLDQFEAVERDGAAMRGEAISRDIVKVTWTKDSSRAPFPGVYAAIDITTKYAKVQRHCGYVIVYQAPSGGAFLVMREENSFLDDEAAEKFRARGQDPDDVWAQVSRVCPNYSPTR